MWSDLAWSGLVLCDLVRSNSTWSWSWCGSVWLGLVLVPVLARVLFLVRVLVMALVVLLVSVLV